MTEKVFTSCTNAGPISVYVKDGRVVGSAAHSKG
jgi:hypothetical protein